MVARRVLSLGACLAALALAGCIALGDSAVPIGTLRIAALRQSKERTLVIVLPGIGGDAAEMKDERLPQAIHESWPEADIVLTSATFAYYRDDKLVPRLDQEIVEPAYASGYTRVWLAGASLGGMGALLYEREHPGKVTGIALFAPFLGDTELLEEIRSAGGLKLWEPGPLPSQMTGDNYQRQVWKMVREWACRPGLARRVWLAVGTRDRFLEGARLLEPELPKTHYLELTGGHTWDLWRAAAREIFSRIRAESSERQHVG
jgi:pimeloyl-ACP methyl ester carboxylesterase